MPKKLIKRFSPNVETLKAHPHLKFLGNKLLNSNLWNINRKCTARSAAIGLFSAFIPIPFQMVLAAGLSVLFSANIPLAVALVWLTNPITMPPIFYAAYRLGAWILHRPIYDINFELSFQWLAKVLHTTAVPLLLGSFILGIIFSILAYFSLNFVWRVNIKYKWKKRKQMRSHNKP
ncbi:MAG: DUF2062 domain-containing protein [Psychromonas sp.]|nr:DUF2062 domain-containing protein [Psychromonas sp.]